MKSIAFYGLLVGLAPVGFAAQAQNSNDRAGWGADSALNRSYDPKAEITFRGRIIGIDSQAPLPGMSPGTAFLVKADNGGMASVDLGPSWYVDHIGSFKLNDNLKVTGSKVMLDNRSVILARKLIKGGHVLYLREMTGFPMWVASRGKVDVLASNKSQGAGPGLAPGEAYSATGPVAIANPNLPAPTMSESQAQEKNAENKPETIDGTVQRMITVPNSQTGQNESVLVVTTPQGTFNVDLGPQWYIEQQSMNVTPGGNITVNALPAIPPVTTFSNGGGNSLVFANTLGYGGQFFVLRIGNIAAWNPWFY